jgi:DNA-binding GntR family transcriptional regulator
VEDKGGKMLRAQAYEALEELIVRQALKPGSRVSEVELSARLGIGRTPIREALQRLAREGLVAIRPREAIVIQEMTHARLLQLIEVRAAVERLLVACAAERATLDERAKMLQLANAVVDAAKIGDGSLYLRVVRELNTLLCESARNEFLYKLMISIYALSRQFAFVHNQRVETRQRAGSYHAAILRAVAAQDQKAALKASDAMIGYLREYARNVERESAAAPRRRAKTGSRTAR